MKKTALYVLVLMQIILLSSCSFGPPIKHYGSNEKLATNLPNVYVKNFQCWDSNPVDGSSYSNVIFTLENNSKCPVKRTTELVFWDGDIRMGSCTWYPKDLEAFKDIPANSAYYGTATCDCEENRKIEFKVTKGSYCY